MFFAGGSLFFAGDTSFTAGGSMFSDGSSPVTAGSGTDPSRHSPVTRGEAMFFVGEGMFSVGEGMLGLSQGPTKHEGLQVLSRLCANPEGGESGDLTTLQTPLERSRGGIGAVESVGVMDAIGTVTMKGSGAEW